MKQERLLDFLTGRELWFNGFNAVIKDSGFCTIDTEEEILQARKERKIYLKSIGEDTYNYVLDIVITYEDFVGNKYVKPSLFSDINFKIVKVHKL